MFPRLRRRARRLPLHQLVQRLVPGLCHRGRRRGRWNRYVRDQPVAHLAPFGVVAGRGVRVGQSDGVGRVLGDAGGGGDGRGREGGEREYGSRGDGGDGDVVAELGGFVGGGPGDA